MKHKLITGLIATLAVVSAQAHEALSPDFARGFSIFEAFTDTPRDGGTFVCPPEHVKMNKLQGTTCSKWVALKDAIPEGRRYTGFSLNNSATKLIVYWK